MNANDIVLLLSSFGGMVIILGGGVKWLLAHIDSKTLAAQQIESNARALLSDRLNEDIRVLRAEMEVLRREKAIYIRRIYQLENFIHSQPGISIPAMEGWPPND